MDSKRLAFAIRSQVCSWYWPTTSDNVASTMIPIFLWSTLPSTPLRQQMATMPEFANLVKEQAAIIETFGDSLACLRTPTSHLSIDSHYSSRNTTRGLRMHLGLPKFFIFDPVALTRDE
ncbi:hypothetical protein BGZ47_003969 [Haplosporangium gracile]|nr:hypothetical protein BGZ47_003969 [Haplosporangium gracile]